MVIMVARADSPVERQPPVVSIGMPVHNGARYIGAAIESILAQTFSDLELIIADDASTDRTSEICRSYASHDSRIQFYSNPRRLGLSENHNRVFQLASAEYFHWTGADDAHDKCFLERCIATLETNPTCALVHTQVRAIDSCGNEITVLDNALTGTSSPRPGDRLAALLREDLRCNVMYGVFRREALRRTSLMRPFHNSDRVLMVETALLGRFLHINEPLFFNRHHSERYSERMELWNSYFHSRITRDHVAFQHCRSWVEYIKAVRRLVPDPSERWACFGQIARCSLDSRHLRWLAWDVGNRFSPRLMRQALNLGHKVVGDQRRRNVIIGD